MPVVKNELEGEAPTEPHLAYLYNGETGEWAALAPGTYMAIIEDPKRPDGTIPVILAKVSRKRITFICACGKQGCTRQAKFNAVWTGHHPHTER